MPPVTPPAPSPAPHPGPTSWRSDARPTARRSSVVAAVVAVVALAVGAVAPTASAQDAPERDPLVVLHGITGSYLADADGDEVWPDEGATVTSLGDDHLDVLALAPDGRTPAAGGSGVRVMTEQGIDGIIGTSQLCFLGSACWAVGDAYAQQFDHLADRGWVLGTDLFAFAYDWRLSPEVNGRRLVTAIRAVLADTGADRVDLLAHSQGGIVTAAALERSDGVGLVDRVATLGTPFLGATKALGVLDYRQPCQAEPPLGLPGCLLNRAKAQELATNWPGFLALLPSRAWHRVDRGAIRTPAGFLGFDAYRQRLSDRNLPLVDAASSFHDRVDAWSPRDPDVELLRVVGDGLGTIRWVREFPVEQCSGIWWWRRCELVDTFEFTMGSGDGTVPTDSADVVDLAAGVDLRGTGRNTYVTGVSHGDLTRDPAVLDRALGFLAGDDAAAGSTARAATVDGSAGLTGTELVARGDVGGVVTDDAGRVLGDGAAGEGGELAPIPGGTHESSDAGDQFVLTEPGRATGTWRVVRDGEMELVARRHVDGAVDAVASTGPFPVFAGATVELDLDVPLRGGRSARIDRDGDGRPDRTVPLRLRRQEPTVATADDEQAPTAAATVSRDLVGRAWWADVDVTATDPGDGSGVASVDWALDASTETGTGTGRLRVPARGELHLRATDAAGNVQAPHTVVVLDDAPSRAEWVQEVARGRLALDGVLEYAADVDVWALEVTEPGRHDLRLLGPATGYDVTVRDADGRVVATLDRRGRGVDRVGLDLDTGLHTVEVAATDLDHDPLAAYRLRLRPGP